MNKDRVLELREICRKMRRDCLVMAKSAGGQGFHYGASLSIIELVAVLYLEIFNLDKENLKKENRNRFILSKGHGVPAVYAALHQMGILSGDDLKTFKNDETQLYGHPSMNEELGIEFSGGSLGQGLSFAVGTALAFCRKKNPARCYVLLGDGECNEGSVWEAALSASKWKLDNLVAVVDCNGLQYDGNTEEVMPMAVMSEKWKSFGWKVCHVDGHDVEQIYQALICDYGKPTVILADTVKGKGISFMENVPSWHYGIMTKEQEKKAWEEVGQDDN